MTNKEAFAMAIANDTPQEAWRRIVSLIEDSKAYIDSELWFIEWADEEVRGERE